HLPGEQPELFQLRPGAEADRRQTGFLNERSPDERSDIRGRPCPVESWSFLHRGFPDFASLIRASVTGFEESIPFRVIRSPYTCFCAGSGARPSPDVSMTWAAW